MRLLSEKGEGVEGGGIGNKERKSKFSVLSGVRLERLLLKVEDPKMLKETNLSCFSSCLLLVLQSDQKAQYCYITVKEDPRSSKKSLVLTIAISFPLF